MMKKFRKLTAVFLSLVMSFSIVVPFSIYASEPDILIPLPIYASEYGVATHMSEDGTMSIASFTLGDTLYSLRSVVGNGYTTLYEYQNGQLIRSGIIYDGPNNKMIVTEYSQALTRGGARVIQSTEVVLLDEFIAEATTEILPVPFQQPGANLMGHIQFSNISGGYLHPQTIRVEYTNALVEQSNLTLWSQTATLLVWAGIISLGLGFPAFGITGIAANIIWGLGAVSTIGGIFLPHITTLHGFRTSYTFELTNISNGFGTTGRFMTWRYHVRTSGGSSWLYQHYFPMFSNNPMRSPWGDFAFGSIVSWYAFRSNRWTLIRWL